MTSRLNPYLNFNGNARQALVPAHRAVRNEPDNWSSWLVLSRLEAEAHHPAASVAAYRRARLLNPQATVFRHAART